MPLQIAPHLIVSVETSLDQAFCETQRHGGVVGETAGLETERSAPGDCGDGFEAAGAFEFDGGAQRVPGRKTD